MLKSGLVEKIAHHHANLSLKEIEIAVNIIMNQLVQALSNNKRIEIRGFGSFTLHLHAPRKAHNPSNGTQIFTQAKYVPYFKPGKELRNRIQASKNIHSIKRDH